MIKFSWLINCAAGKEFLYASDCRHSLRVILKKLLFDFGCCSGGSWTPGCIWVLVPISQGCDIWGYHVAILSRRKKLGTEKSQFSWFQQLSWVHISLSYKLTASRLLYSWETKYALCLDQIRTTTALSREAPSCLVLWPSPFIHFHRRQTLSCFSRRKRGSIERLLLTCLVPSAVQGQQKGGKRRGRKRDVSTHRTCTFLPKAITFAHHHRLHPKWGMASKWSDTIDLRAKSVRSKAL